MTLKDRGTVVPLVLPTGATIGRSGQVANTRLVNAYPEQSGAQGGDGKSAFAIYGATNLKRWDSGDYAGACRGLMELNSTTLIGILGNEVVSFDADGNPTTIGAIVGSKRLHMARNRNAAVQIAMLTESSQVFVLQSGSITQVTDPDLPAPISVSYLSGFGLYGIQNGRIYATALEDFTSISAGAFGDSKADDSDLVKVHPDSNYMYVFNKRGTEIWRPNETAPNSAFLFSPTQQSFSYGTSSPHSVISVPGKGICWVDHERIVRLGRDANAAKISDPTIARQLEMLTAAQLADVYCYYYTFQDHEVIQMVSDLWTWEYLIDIGRWVQRKSYARPRYRAHAHEFFAGKHIVGNDEDGKLYYYDTETYSDAGDFSVMEVWCAHSQRFPGDMIVHALIVDVIGGVGLSDPATIAIAASEDSFTKALLHFDGNDGATTISDRTGKTWTASGNAQIDSWTSVFGGASLLLDGTGDYVSTADSSDFNLGSGDWTVEFWFNCNAAGGTTRALAGQCDAGGTATATSFRISRDTSNVIRAFCCVGGSFFTCVGTTTFTDALNTGWHHCAFVRSGSTLKLFIDGIQEGGDTSISGTVNNSAEIFTIGADNAGGSDTWQGWIDEFRLSVGVARWTADFTPPVVAYSPALVIDDIDPKLMIDYSDDGGASFTGERQVDLGRAGMRKQSIRTNGWGRVTNEGRIWRFRASAKVIKGIIQASLIGEPLKNG